MDKKRRDSPVSTMTPTVKRKRKWVKHLVESRWLLLMFFLPLVYFIVFKYGAMTWLVIAFKKFSAVKGIWGSRWVGTKYFVQFLNDPYFWKLVRNTVVINLLLIIFSFPIPILLSLLINEHRVRQFRKTVQTISYMPYFVSTVAVCGLITTMLSSDGMVTNVLKVITGNTYSYLTDPQAFRVIYIISEIWSTAGWGSIIYLAALTGIDPGLYEAAQIDGASRWKQVLHISLPGIASVISIQLLLTIGRMLDIGYEKILLLYTGATYETADVVSTYLYRRSLLTADYSYGCAISLFQGIMSLLLVSAANQAARKIGETSLW